MKRTILMLLAAVLLVSACLGCGTAAPEPDVADTVPESTAAPTAEGLNPVPQEEVQEPAAEQAPVQSTVSPLLASDEDLRGLDYAQITEFMNGPSDVPENNAIFSDANGGQVGMAYFANEFTTAVTKKEPTALTLAYDGAPNPVVYLNVVEATGETAIASLLKKDDAAEIRLSDTCSVVRLSGGEKNDYLVLSNGDVTVECMIAVSALDANGLAETDLIVMLIKSVSF